MSENLPIISSFLRRRGERSSSSDSVDTTVLQLLMSLLRRPCRRRRIDDDMFRGEVVTSRRAGEGAEPNLAEIDNIVG